ncbi:MAG: HAD-IA family hydrolase [Treponema sp.]|nr:HAD-IA family hydrolase [Treponema sp.]
MEHLNTLDETALLPGSRKCLALPHNYGIRIALGSASENAPFILERLNIKSFFDAVVDGDSAGKAKPDPEVFLKAAGALSLPPRQRVAFEDSASGVKAAKTGGVMVIGVGEAENLAGADYYIASLLDMLTTRQQYTSGFRLLV